MHVDGATTVIQHVGSLAPVAASHSGEDEKGMDVERAFYLMAFNRAGGV